MQVDMQEVKALCARIKTILELQNNSACLADIENIKKGIQVGIADNQDLMAAGK